MAIDKEKILSIAQKYILGGQSKKAIKEYLKLIEAAPKDKRLYLKLGDLYLKNGENEKAINEYLKLADLYVEEDLNFRAISIYKKVLSINPKHTETFRNIANLYLKEGLVGSARGYYQSVLEIQPDDQEGLKALKSIEDHQQPREVPKALSTLEAPPPKSPHRRIEDHQQPREVPKALSTLEAPPPKFPHPPGKKVMGEKSSLPPPPPIHETPILSDETETTSVDKDSEMHYHLGIAYKEMDLFDYAVSEFELASSNPSIKCDCYIMLGNCFMERGDYDKSIEYYKMASEIKGLSGAKLARLHFSLGLVYEASGMVSEALDSFHLVLKLDHSVSEAQEKIKKLQQK